MLETTYSNEVIYLKDEICLFTLKNMYLDIQALPEVISVENFKVLLEDVLKNKDYISRYTSIHNLAILGEKFEKFYDLNIIDEFEKTQISDLLIASTNFENIDLVEELLAIMFQFRLNEYNDYLKASLSLIKSKEIYEEISSAIAEYDNLG